MTPRRGVAATGARVAWIVALALFALLVGAIVSPGLERAVRGYLPAAWQPAPAPATPLEIAGLSTRLETARADLDALARRVAALETRGAGDEPAAALNDTTLAGMAPGAAQTASPGLARRLDAIEARIAAAEDASAGAGRRVDQLSARTAEAARASAANADRAFDLLLVEAVRRAMVRGEGLAALMPMLTTAFARDEAAAIAALGSLARAPVVAARLPARVARLRAELAAGEPAADTFAAQARATIDGLVRLRPAEERARAALLDVAERRFAAGDVAGGVTALARLRTARGAPLLADARRLLAAQTALARIETAALANPPR